MSEFISNNYILFSLLGLLGVYLLLYISGLTGNKELFRVAWLQYIFVIILVLSTPFILSSLSLFDEESANEDSNKNKKVIASTQNSGQDRIGG